MLRRKGRQDDGDRFDQWLQSLEPRWQVPVRAAMASRDQFAAIVDRTPAGPTRERLASLGPTLETALARVTDAAWRAANASAFAAGLDAQSATAELKEARRRLDAARRSGRGAEAARAHVDALAQRHQAIHDALNLAEDAALRLEGANVRLETLVARAATISLRSTGGDPMEDFEAELRDVVDGLGALDEALARYA